MEGGPGFKKPELAQWRALAEGELKGGPFEKQMITSTPEGVAIPALSTEWSGPVDPTPVPTRTAQRWAIVQAHDDPSLTTAAGRIAEDLAGGADGLMLVVGNRRLRLDSAADLDLLLGGVSVSTTPIYLDAGARFAEVGKLLHGYLVERGLPPEAHKGGLGADPLAALARGEPLKGGLEATYDRWAEQCRLFEPATGFELINVDTTVHHDAGADAALELGAGLSTIVAHLRALESRGLDPVTLAPRLALTIALGADPFMAIATLRAARLLYAELARHAALPPRITLAAVASRRALSTIEPANNLLRATTATFAAAIGGADRMTTYGHDGVVGPASAFGRRYARGAQLVLGHEANLGEVIDPAGGSWLFEELTDHLARAAWAVFQGLESKGGMTAALTNGAWRATLQRAAKERMIEIRRLKTKLTGVSLFPTLEEPALLPPKPGNGGPPAAESGDLLISALPVLRLSEPFEILRLRSDRLFATTGQRPRVFVATIGPKAEHGARVEFVEQLLLAGGIVTTGEGAQDPAAACKASGCQVAIIAGSDEAYATSVPKLAPMLKAAGAQAVLVVARPGDDEDLWRDSGVDAFLFAGGDTIEVLDQLYGFVGDPS